MNLLRILLAGICLCISNGAMAADHAWDVTDGKDKSTIYEIPVTPGTVSSIARIYYDVLEQQFLIDVATAPAGLKSNQPANPQHQMLIITPATGATVWRQVNPVALAANNIFVLPPHGVSLLMSSQLLRATGNQTVEQPFGKFKTRLMLLENSYIKKTIESGLPGGKDKGWIEQTFGYGGVIWSIFDDSNKIVFSMRENFTDNSGTYTGAWSPDGLYQFIVAPDNAFIIAGPFATDTSPMLVVSRLSTEHEKKAHEVELDNQYADGRISAEDRYGAPYKYIIDKIRHCPMVFTQTGYIKNLNLRGPENAAPFGNPETIGRHFLFAYTADNNSGMIEASGPTPEGWNAMSGAWTAYLESITIRHDQKVSYVRCP